MAYGSWPFFFAFPLFLGQCLRIPERTPKGPHEYLTEADYKTGPNVERVGGDEWVERPTGPLVEPVGRHIQMLYWDHGHGLTDRIWKYFRPLVILGQYYNATVHIVGGSAGPRRLLTGAHSLEIAKSWGRYFDLEANGGNPWHEPQNFRGCREIKKGYSRMELLALFDGGERCVNILARLYMTLPEPLLSMPSSLPVSQAVASAALRFRKRYDVPENYGSCHIRRCDLYEHNGACTEPSALAGSVADVSGNLTTWIFFLYAEKGYREALQRALAPLKKKLLFEGSAVLNDVYPEDNYFTYILGKHLNGDAETIVETHICRSGRPVIYHAASVQSEGLYLAGERQMSSTDLEAMGDLFLDVEEKVGAVCDDRSRGAKLLHPNSTDADQLKAKGSNSVREHER